MDRPVLIYDDETDPGRDKELFAVGRYTLDAMRCAGVYDVWEEGSPRGEDEWSRIKRIMASTRLEHVYFRDPAEDDGESKHVYFRRPNESEDQCRCAVPCDEWDDGAWVCTRLVLILEDEG